MAESYYIKRLIQFLVVRPSSRFPPFIFVISDEFFIGFLRRTHKLTHRVWRDVHRRDRKCRHRHEDLHLSFNFVLHFSQTSDLVKIFVSGSTFETGVGNARSAGHIWGPSSSFMWPASYICRILNKCLVILISKRCFLNY